MPAPANDNFANAILISGSSGSTTGSNVSATAEVGEPAIPFFNGDLTVWWKWVATGDGVLQVDFAASALDTTVAVYKGTTLAGLQRVGANDDWYVNTVSQGGGSLVRARVESGATYYIQVAGYDDATGAISFAWSVSAPTVANDYFENATTISGSSGSTSGSLTGASSELGEPWFYPPGTPTTEQFDEDDNAVYGGALVGTFDGNYDWGGWSRWYTWTCPADGAYQFDCIGSTEFTLLGVFPDASTPAQLDLQRGRANGYGGLPDFRSLVTIRCTAGAVYKVCVQGDYGGTGNFVLNWGTITPPSNDNIADAVTLSGTSGSVSGTTINATFEDDELKTPDLFGSGRSVWYKVNLGIGGWLSFTLTGGSNGISAFVLPGPAGATSFSQLSFDGYDRNFRYNSGSLTFTSLAFTGWAYIQIDSNDGVGTNFTLAYSVVKAEDSITHTTPTISGGTVNVGYLELDGERRNLDVTMTYTLGSIEPSDGVGGFTLFAYWYPTIDDVTPGTPGSTTLTPRNTGWEVAANNEEDGAVRANFYQGAIGTYTDSKRIPIPEGAVGILYLFTFPIEAGTSVTSISSYSASFVSAERPVNDQPHEGIVMSAAGGTYTIPPEAWAGATAEENERIPRKTREGPFLGGNTNTYVGHSHGRSLWFRWTPTADNQTLFLYERRPQDTYADRISTTVTVFTNDGAQKILYGGWPWRWWELWNGVDSNGDPNGSELHPLWPEGQGRWYYQPIPARHDIAGTRSELTTYYVRYDIAAATTLPLEDWTCGWFALEDPLEQYGPDDFAILSGNDIGVGAGADTWYEEGHLDDATPITSSDDFWGFIEPSPTAISGRLGKQFDVPHPNEESTLVAGGAFYQTNKYWVFGDVDTDGTVYSIYEGELRTSRDDTFVTEHSYIQGTSTWDRGLLNIATSDRFRAALDQAQATASPAIYTDLFDLEEINIVGSEVWISCFADNPSSNYRARVRCDKQGNFLGVVYRDFPEMIPVNRARTKFISGNQIWDTSIDAVHSTGLPAGDWMPYKYGVVRSKSVTDARIYFTSNVLGSPSKDVPGHGWQSLGTYNGGVAAVTQMPFRDMNVAVTWSSGFPTSGGVVWRLRDGSNYLVAKRDGVYRVVNGVATVVTLYNAGYVIPSTGVGTMTVEQYGSSGDIRVSVNGTQRLLHNSSTFWPNELTHRRTLATSGFKVGVVNSSSPTAFSTMSIGTNTLGTSDHIVIDGTNSQYDTWDGTYRFNNWNLTYDIVNAEGYSPYFDTMNQSFPYNIAVGEDGTTLYVIRWFEPYEANARDYGYDNLTGNWIQTHVYAFDLETRTMIGKVGKYDCFPSWSYYDLVTVYPYTILGGNIYSGAREKSTFSNMEGRTGRPTVQVRGEIGGLQPGDRYTPIDGLGSPVVSTNQHTSTGGRITDVRTK